MSTKIFKVSELFMSLEGEGPYNSRPTAYVRFGQCNLKCPGFNNHNNELSDTGYAKLSFNPAEFTQLKDIPLITSGCDSQYAVNPEFEHMWVNMTADEIVSGLINILPHNKWVHPVTKLPVILSLTGGEPMLNAKWFKDILQHSRMKECKHVLIETNCTVHVSNDVALVIRDWLSEDTTRKWSWSNSPKLSASGEDWKAAIKPKVALSQFNVANVFSINQIDQYFKFVVSDKSGEFNEVDKVMETYYEAGLKHTSNVWIMPAACTTEQQNDIAKSVANMCMNRGYIFCYRLQNALWGNGVGT